MSDCWNKEVISKEAFKTSRKCLTVTIFQKWQDSSVTLWIKIAVILKWRYKLEIWYGLVWISMVWYGFGMVWFCWYSLVYISSNMKKFQSWTIMDYHRVGGGGHNWHR